MLPKSRVVILNSPAIAAKSEAQLYDQGITYNQAGLTYNEIGITYGGVFGAKDARIPISLAQAIHPTIVRSYDQQGTVTIPPAGNSGYLVGMLGMTYP